MNKKISITVSLKVVLIITFIIVLVSLFILQIYHGTTYNDYALKNYVRKYRIAAKRGEIFDRNGLPIVQNYPAIHLSSIPHFIADLDSLKTFLNSNFQLDSTEVDSILYDARFRKYKKNSLVDNLTTEQLAIAAENFNYFPSLRFDIGNTRRYQIPNHFTGYLGRINRKEYLEQQDNGYNYNSYIGKTGIEKQYEDLLRGKDGIGLRLVDAKGRDLELFTDLANQKDNISIPAVDGNDITLTIDLNLQKFVDSQFKDKQEGAAIVMNYESGEILAYVSRPTMDQNIYMSHITNKTWEAIRSDTTKPFLDRVDKAIYPPGSVFKVITASFGLDNNIVNRWTKLSYCDGGMHVGNRYFKCWNRYGHGTLNVVEALKMSCDVYFYDLSLKMDLDDFCYYLKDCMLSQRTGIDLPSESKGFFPTKKWYKNTYGKYTSVKGHMVNLSIGQGELFVTPLQICALYSGIANNGLWNKPHLFKNATKDSKIINYDSVENNRLIELPMKESTLKIIQEGLREVVVGKHGTANSLNFKGRHIYGKTGSAEHKKGRLTHGWFAGYDLDTKIAVVTFRQEAGHGGSVAVPIAREIFKYYYKYINESKNEH